MTESFTESLTETLNDANEELKRIDHLIYVSLKYTRTVDVLLNTIERMINGYEFMIDALLKSALEKKMVPQLPPSPIERGEIVTKLFQDDRISEAVKLYFLLRKLSKSKPKRECEFRKHLTMRSVINGEEEIVNIEIITNYYKFQKDFFDYVKDLLLKKDEKE